MNDCQGVCFYRKRGIYYVILVAMVLALALEVFILFPQMVILDVEWLYVFLGFMGFVTVSVLCIVVRFIFSKKPDLEITSYDIRTRFFPPVLWSDISAVTYGKLPWRGQQGFCFQIKDAIKYPLTFVQKIRHDFDKPKNFEFFFYLYFFSKQDVEKIKETVSKYKTVSEKDWTA